VLPQLPLSQGAIMTHLLLDQADEREHRCTKLVRYKVDGYTEEACEHCGEATMIWHSGVLVWTRLQGDLKPLCWRKQ
jgi:hypothetical protein